MISEPFVVEKSRINQVNPTARIVFATAYSFIIALSYRFPALFTACFLSVLMVCLSGLNLFAVAKRLAVVNGLILLIWLILPFTYSGEPVFNIGPFAITGQGIILSAQITLKSNAILLAVIALISSMSLVTLGHALSRLRIPEKIVFLFLMTVRYIFVIESEYLRLVRAMKIRGFKPGTNLHTYKTYAYLIGMIFVRASVRAQHVHQAMMCRGFKGNFYSLYKFSSTRLSWIFSTVMTGSLIGLVLLETAF
jgi:cobalt/nickel transport system permease protein